MPQVKVLRAVEKGDVYELSWFVGKNKKLWGDILEKVKMIPQRRFNPESKKWTCPITSRNKHLISSIGFRIESKKKEEPKRDKVKTTFPTEYKKEVLRDVDPRLRDYQLDGVKFWQYGNFNKLNLDDMGIGKTAQALSAIRTSKIRPALIVCPASLKLNFEREAKMWLNSEDKDKVHVVHGMLNMWYKDADIVIINYDMLWKHLEYILREFKPNLVVADEAHVLKGDAKLVGPWHPTRLKPKDLSDLDPWELEQTITPNEFLKKIGKQHFVFSKAPQRVRAIRYIVNGLSEKKRKQFNLDWGGLRHFMPMTGTPITKSAADIFNLLNLLDKDKFKNREKFEEMFCVTEQDYKKGHRKVIGAKNMDILHKILFENYAIRRTKKQVLTELPPTIKTVVPLELSTKHRKEYDKIEDDFLQWIKEVEESGEEVSDDIKRKRFKLLMDLATDGKLEACFKFIDNIVNNSDEKVLVFSYNTRIVEGIRDRYEGKSVMLNGTMTPKQRQESVDKFQNDKKIQVFSGQTEAAAVGITLTAGHIYISVQTGWWAHLIQQGIDRLNRMGQVADKVLAYFLPADDTIEKYLLGKLDSEQAIIDAIVDGKDVEEKDTLVYLWEKYKEKAKIKEEKYK